MSERYQGSYKIAKLMRELAVILDGAKATPQFGLGNVQAAYVQERIRSRAGRTHRLTVWTRSRGVALISLDTSIGEACLMLPADFPAEHPKARADYGRLIQYLDSLLTEKKPSGRLIIYKLKEHGS